MKKELLMLNHKYSVGSGVFAGIDKNFYMKLDECGRYKYFYDKKIDKNLLIKINKVDIMSDYSENEDSLGKKIFGNNKNIKHNNLIGYYDGLYAGYVSEGDFRDNASSGGFGTWILCELLKTGNVDWVIHPKAVNPKDNNGILFKYSISQSENEIKNGSKSYYYPMELSEMLKIIKNTPGKYAIIGISEFITELRLLCEQKPVFKDRIVFMIGLFNAHQKSAKYAEALAWQQGIRPGDLEKIDFRVKTNTGEAWEYKHRFQGICNGKKTVIEKNIKKSLIQRWSMGFFKSRFSDFTDNAFNELADITLGDAWLSDYIKDPKGNNILIVRNYKIKKMIETAIKNGRLNLDIISEEDIISSQQIVSHIIDELPYRLYVSKKNNNYVPKKRLQPAKNIPFLRRRVQDLRRYIVDKNDAIYNRALKKNKFNIYIKFIDRCQKINDFLYFIMASKSSIKNYIRTAIDKSNHLKTYLEKAKRKLQIRTRILNLLKKISTGKKYGAIISLTGFFNYGNIIQRYALKQFLEKNGYNFDAIRMQKYEDRQDIAIYGNMIDFVNNNIKEKIFDASDIVNYKNYIVGSDQVWRNWYGDSWEELGVFFLDFLGKRKNNRIAYAASFGVDNLTAANLDDKKRKLIKPLIRRFNHISLREKTGIKLARELAENNKLKAEIVVDPVFLLKKEDYSSLIEKSNLAETKIPKLFCYILDSCDEKMNFIKNISTKFDNEYLLINPAPDKKYNKVEEWLKGFRDSELVITDSFHGVALSIINNKNFVVFINQIRGSSRIKCLLNTFGINEDRMLCDDSVDADSLSGLKEINWELVNKNVDREVVRSKKWIQDVLNRPLK